MEYVLKFFEYASKPFVWHALVVGIIIALCSSLLGVMLVLKHYSFIGDALSHVAFGAMAIAGILGIVNKMELILPVTILCAIFLMWPGKKQKNNDAFLAIVSVFSLAFGYVIINLFSKSGNVSGDVCASLFGSTSILTLSDTEVLISIGLSILVTILFIFFYGKVFSLTFDEDFAKSAGVNVRVYGIGMATVIAVVIVLAMNLVGSLLVSALIIFPSMTAMQVFHGFKTVTIASVIFSVVGAFLGMAISIVIGTPVGSTIVAIQFIMFIFCFIIRRFMRK